MTTPDVPPHIYYVSPSILPSRSANSIHVIRMCEAMALNGSSVTLFCQSGLPDGVALEKALSEYYGVRLTNVRVLACHRASLRAVNLAIAHHALWHLFTHPVAKSRVFVSRNLYASAALKVLGLRPLVYETHQVEGGWRRRVQRFLLRSPDVAKVVVSKSLRNALEVVARRPLAFTTVLHDAAPTQLADVPASEGATIRALSKDAPWPTYARWAGYVGHIYPGRGIELILQLAHRFPTVGFLIVGGNPDDVAVLQRQNLAANVFLLGHQPPARALELMRAVDLLLMPYQRRVSIGIEQSDTAQWMSPLKMFEYMASGVPFVASRLPVLGEVLREGENCLMAEPDNLEEWCTAMSTLLVDSDLAHRLCHRAKSDYLAEHTWPIRARRLLKFATEGRSPAGPINAIEHHD